MATRKLLSLKDTILGTVTYPNWWEEHLQGPGSAVRFASCPPISLQDYLDPSSEVMTKVGTLVLHRYDEGAVRLYGFDLEEFEKLPGCSFSPGAAYLRSLIDSG